jgi:uncharacterized sulfatase
MLASLLVLVLHPFLGQSAGGAEPRPNIVLVFIDDMGWGDFSCFGNTDATTDHIDRLAG